MADKYIVQDKSIKTDEGQPNPQKEGGIVDLQDNKTFEMSPFDSGSQKFPEASASPFTRSMSKIASQLSMKRDYSVPKNSTSRTILVMVNTLIGSGCLLLPLVMKDSGIITTIISLTIIGVISAKTCEIPLMHTEEGERDLPDVIVRLLGDKWYYFYSLSAGLLEILIALAYYLMSCNMFYHIMQFICYYADTTVTSYEEIEFGQFSYQWFFYFLTKKNYFFLKRICVILFVLFYLLCCMDNFKIVMILNQYGFICIICFIIFVVYNLIVNICNDNLNSSKQNVDINWVTLDVGYIFGVIAILYLVHPNTVKIFAEHAKQQTNIKSHRWAFGITFSIYVFIGITGYLGILNVSLPSGVDTANTVLDYFEANDISNLLISLIFFGDLVSVFPILLQTGKVLCVQAVWVQYDVKKHKLVTRIFDLCFMIISFLLGIFNISPSSVLSFAGAFIGFLLIYIIPIFMHLLCIYQQDFFLVKYSAIYIPPSHFTKIATEFSPMDENHQLQQEACFSQPDQILKTEQPTSPFGGKNEEVYFKCKHENLILKWLTKQQRYIIYGAFQLIGLAILVNQIYQIIKG